ncbi:unnamed protein product [Amoebophrya sp. A25]|nr:unnamed protein product [Amoebophrya sp. A25]|eukprot:GSA25T00014221001.1
MFNQIGGFGDLGVGGDGFSGQFGNASFGDGGGQGFIVAPATPSQPNENTGTAGGAAAAGAGGGGQRGGAGGSPTYTPITIYQRNTQNAEAMRETGGGAKPQLYGIDVRSIGISGQVTEIISDGYDSKSNDVLTLSTMFMTFLLLR